MTGNNQQYKFDDRGSYAHVVFAPDATLCSVADQQHGGTLYTTDRPLAQKAARAMNAYTDPQRSVLHVNFCMLFQPGWDHLSELTAEFAVPVRRTVMEDVPDTPLLSRVAHAAHCLISDNSDKARVMFMGAGGSRAIIIADRVGFGQVRLSRPDDDTWSRQYNY